MKKRALLSLLLALLLLLSGCAGPITLGNLAARFRRSDASASADTVSVWRLSSDRTGGELIRAEAYPSPAAEEPDELLALFSTPSRTDGLRCALPDDVSLEDWSLDSGVAVLTFSESYLALPAMEQTAAALCAALTLCQLESVDAVTVAAGGQIVYAGLMPEDAFLSAAGTDPYVRQLRLYFPDGDGRYLLSEYHSLTLDEDTSPERYVVEELLRGPNNGELQSVMPAGTRLLSCSTGSDGVCTVDLSQEFYDNRPRTALDERLVLYALVNSLTALSAVDRVRILVEGQSVNTYVYRSLAEPLSRYEEAVGPVSQPRGETDLDLFLAMPGLQAITPLPFRIRAEGYDSTAEAALAALLDAEEPGFPSLFTGGASILSVTIRNAQCVVDLSESFFASLPEEARAVAVQSMAATLCALPDISSVRFTVGGADAVFDGVEWSGPWHDFTEFEVP